MVFEDTNFTSALRLENIQLFARTAYEFYITYNVKKNIADKALKVIKKYLIKIRPSLPRNPKSLYIDALYIACRGISSYPNEISKRAFAEHFRVKPSSINWYVKEIMEKLAFFKLYDSYSRPYFLGPLDSIYYKIKIIIKMQITIALTDNNTIDKKNLIDEILTQIICRFKLIPIDISRGLRNLVLFFLKEILKEKCTTHSI